MRQSAKIRLRLIVGILMICFGTFHGLYYITGLLGGWEKDLWNAAQGAAGLTFAGLGLWVIRWREKEFQGPAKVFLRLVQTGIVLGLFGMFALYGVIWSGSHATGERDADYVLILGARVNGETISLSLKERLDRGLAYMSRHPNATLILSGGKGPGEQVTEAKAMKAYLVSKGVREQSILTEEKSTSTYENMIFTRDMLKSKGIDVKDRSFIVITNDFHMYRSLMLARRAGIHASGLAAPTPPYILPKSYGREFAALVKSYFFDR